MFSANDALHIPARVNCACPGEVLTYTCNITGGGNTIWGGTAFDCAFNEIILRHSQFTFGIFGECNNGRIVAMTIGVMNNFYVSELNVTVNASLHNKTIQCSHSSYSFRIIDTSVITVVTGKFIYYC